MKGLRALVAVLVVTGLLAGAVTASASTAAYKHYIGCGISRNATPSHVCPKKAKKGAFFKSLKGDVNYSVCVKFPSGKNLCAQAQEAKKGTLYVNKVTSTIPGRQLSRCCSCASTSTRPGFTWWPSPWAATSPPQPSARPRANTVSSRPYRSWRRSNAWK